MKRHILILAVSLASCIPAYASNWHHVYVGNDEVKYFFDADSVEKGKSKTVIVWLKSVRTTKADTDGSWATALRWKFDCTKRTIQSLMWSTYDQNGKFIKSSSNPDTETSVTPDSIGEGMLKVACEPSFPNDKSGKIYFKIENNDPILATKNYVEYLKSQIDQAPK